MWNTTLVEKGYDAVVIGAGVVGAACAHFLASAGASVAVVDRGWVAGGTSGAGEGNILVSDKELGPELELALLSNRLWRELGEQLGSDIEFEAKGGLVVAADGDTLTGLNSLAEKQRASGVEAIQMAADELPALEPNIARDLHGGISYPQDLQVQPMLAAAHLLAAARGRAGEGGRRVTFHGGREVTGILRGKDGSATGVTTSAGSISAGAVVNAAGTWVARSRIWQAWCCRSCLGAASSS